VSSCPGPPTSCHFFHASRTFPQVHPRPTHEPAQNHQLRSSLDRLFLLPRGVLLAPASHARWIQASRLLWHSLCPLANHPRTPPSTAYVVSRTSSPPLSMQRTPHTVSVAREQHDCPSAEQCITTAGRTEGACVCLRAHAIFVGGAVDAGTYGGVCQLRDGARARGSIWSVSRTPFSLVFFVLRARRAGRFLLANGASCL
ncbi:hypothetical protein C8F04DRAFT_1129229, partial [Mycena alexandri]